MNTPEVRYCPEEQIATFTFSIESPFSDVAAEVIVSYARIDGKLWEVPTVKVMIDNAGFAEDFAVNLNEQITILVNTQQWLISNRSFVERSLRAL